MKELASAAGNHFAKYDDTGNLVPAVEVIINTTEPVYRLGPDGQIIKKRDCFTIRFVTDPESLRRLGRKLMDEATVAESAITSAMSDQPTTPRFFTQDGSEMFWRWDGRRMTCLEVGAWVPSHFTSPADLVTSMDCVSEIQASELPTGTKA